MTYREILQKQIRDLEEQIASATTTKGVLQQQLERLKIQEFGEDLKEQGQQQLLQE